MGLCIMLIINRRTFTFGLGSIALRMTSMCAAQPFAVGRGWSFTPSIGVVFAEEDDPRLPLVGEAVAFWNKVFS